MNTQDSEWHSGEGRCIRKPSWENYGHVVLRVRWSEEIAAHAVEFQVGEEVLPESYRASIKEAALHWLDRHAAGLGQKKAHVVITGGSTYGIGSYHAEATEFALADAAARAGLLK